MIVERKNSTMKLFKLKQSYVRSYGSTVNQKDQKNQKKHLIYLHDKLNIFTITAKVRVSARV
jgi:hypothetical protein